MATLLVAKRQRVSPGVRGGSSSGLTLAAAVLGFFVITLDAVVVNVALPSIQRDLGGGISDLQWVVDGYTLMFAALLLSAGALSDRVGARRAFAASSGPVLGGVLTLVTWRLIFFINLPVGAVALLLLARTERSPHRPVPLDWVGQGTAVLAMGALTYGAIEAGADGFAAPRVVTAFAVAVVVLAAFLAAQARGEHPMMPLDLFRSRNVAVTVAVGFAFIVGYYGLPFVMSLYLQQLRGLSSLGTGVAFLPMMLIGAVLTPLSARVAERLGARVLITSGLVLMTAGLVILGVLPSSTPVWVLSVLMVLVGLGGPLVMPPAAAVLLNSVPAHRAGTASGVFNTSRQLGGALAVAVFGALLAQPATFPQGLRTSLLLAAGVAVAAGASSLLLRPGSKQQTPAAEATLAPAGAASVGVSAGTASAQGAGTR